MKKSTETYEQVNLVERYDCRCPKCEYEFVAALSMFQLMGNLDAGHGSCPSCKLFLNLTFDPNNKKMICIPWEDYLIKINVNNRR
jgi:hypothetical protein